jgi:MFS family permease
MGKFRLDFGALKKYTPRSMVLETADVFRQLSKTDSNITVFILYGLIYDVVLNLFRPFALKYLDRVGGTEFHISLFNSLPGLAAVVAIIPGSLLINRFKRKKRVTTVFFGVSRSFILMLVLLPFIPLNMQPIIFVLLISANNLFDAVGQNSFQGLLGGVLTGHMRSRAIGLRNKFGNAVVMLITIVTGMIITFVPRTDEGRVLIYQTFFALAFAASLFELFVFSKFKEKPITEEPELKVNTLKTLGSTFKDKRFTRFMAFSLFFYFTWHMGWPLGGIFQIKTLGANEMWIAFMALSSGLAAFFAATRWAKLINKRGNWFALGISAVMISGNMFLYTVTYHLPFMIFVTAWGGAAAIGISTGLFNGMLSSTPDKDRVVYIGVYNTLVNISLAVSPFVTLYLINALEIRPAAFVVGCLRLIAGALLFYEHRRLKKLAKDST